MLTLARFLLLAYRSCIKVFARATSLHVRSLAISKDTDLEARVTGLKLAPRKPEQLYVTSESGLIELWDWKDGKRLRRWRLSSRILGLDVASVRFSDEPADIVFTTDVVEAEPRITAHRLPMAAESRADVRTLCTSRESLSPVRALNGGRCLVAYQGQKLLVGLIVSETSPRMESWRYVWREFQVPELISTFDVRPSGAHRESRGSNNPNIAFDIDVAVGGCQGALYLYRNVLREFQLLQRSTMHESPRTTKMHWHQNAVATLKWSLDGEYLISGGLETVLVLWQLDTGQKQTLPHLGAAIEAISVSGNGASYAIRLADNSVMVISTQELQPTTHVPGILMRQAQEPLSGGELGPASRRPAVAASRRSPSGILLAVPSALPTSSRLGTTSSASYLQTIDPTSATQVARQALTRTKVTDRNVGPTGNVIDEPNVVLIDTSFDGRWLASVEEWAPPLQDLDLLSTSKRSALDRQERLIEVTLKFWSWDESSRSWELVSKVEKPHQSTGTESEPIGLVADLASNPGSTGFVTVGNDGRARIWQPRTRTRGALEVKGNDAAPLRSWSCRQSVPLPGHARFSEEPRRNSIRCALSDDGSLLAVACHYEPLHAEPSSRLHLINTEQNALLATRTDLFSGPLADIGILGRSLILLSSQLLVWDLVTDRPRWAIDLRAAPLLLAQPGAFHLALDRRNATFAIAVPVLQDPEGEPTKKKKKRKRRGAKLAVFTSEEGPAPRFAAALPKPVRALVAAESSHAYFAIDADAELHRVRAQVFVPEAPTVEPKRVEPALRGLERIYGSATLRARPVTEDEGEDDEAERKKPKEPERDGLAFVTQDQLRKIWGHYDPLRMPPMEKLFEQVAALVSGVPS